MIYIKNIKMTLEFLRENECVININVKDKNV